MSKDLPKVTERIPGRCVLLVSVRSSGLGEGQGSGSPNGLEVIAVNEDLLSVQESCL